MPRAREAFRQQKKGIREVDNGLSEPIGGGRNSERHAVGMGQAKDETKHGGKEHP